MSPSTSTPQDAYKRPNVPKPAFDIQVDDTVRIGNSKVLWRVASRALPRTRGADMSDIAWLILAILSAAGGGAWLGWYIRVSWDQLPDGERKQP